jgi:hypothetical protein
MEKLVVQLTIELRGKLKGLRLVEGRVEATELAKLAVRRSSLTAGDDVCSEGMETVHDVEAAVGLRSY